jgi:hypothetical protein
MLFLAGTIDAKGFKYVIAGNASPAVDVTYLISKASPEACDWGPDSSDEAIGHLADLVMNRVIPTSPRSSRVRQKLMSYFRHKTVSDKMWLITHESLLKEILDSVTLPIN